jgi:hypothetical protein
VIASFQTYSFEKLGYNKIIKQDYYKDTGYKEGVLI